MALPNTFDSATTKNTLARLEKLSPDTQPNWGKMNAAQMLAHLNIAYDITYKKTPTNYNFFMKFMLKTFVKKSVVQENPPYPKNSRTAPAFIIADQRDFDKEKEQLIKYIGETEKNGKVYFEGLAHDAFGKMSAKEWSVLFQKHLDHHFSQFGL